MNNAGRNWTFVFGSIQGINSTIANQTFIVTLAPLPLQSLPKFGVTLNENLTLASIIVSNCDQVAEAKLYLTYQCQNDGNGNNYLSDSCTFTCPVQSDSVYNVSVVRLPVPIHDGTEAAKGTFPMDQRVESFRIGKTDICIFKNVFSKMKFLSLSEKKRILIE